MVKGMKDPMQLQIDHLKESQTDDRKNHQVMLNKFEDISEKIQSVYIKIMEMELKINNLQDELQKKDVVIEKMQSDISMVKNALVHAKGSWKIIMSVGALVGGVIGFFTDVSGLLKSFFTK